MPRVKSCILAYRNNFVRGCQRVWQLVTTRIVVNY